MRKIPALKFILNSLIASTILLFFLNPPTSFASHKIFQENFDANSEGSFPNGWILVNDSDRTPCAATWKVHDGMAGIAIVNQGSCTTNIIPDDTKWNSLGNNYIFELDMKFVNGTDHNVAFRFTPTFPSNDWYDLHFQSPGDFVLERINPGIYNVFVPQNYPNNQMYHIKILVNKNNIKVYIDSLLVRDYTSDVDRFPSGRIALRAGTGADPSSETYFDNIVVTNIDEAPATLPVPYFSQNALPWGPSEYDNAISLGFSNTTMDRWGCAVTSAAMVLNYHNIKQFADNTPIDPGSLNEWLKNNKGYATGTGSDGETYSWINLNAISALSKKLIPAGKSTTTLEWKRRFPSIQTTNTINEDLTTRNIPVILHTIKAGLTTGHFVVAKGITNNIYDINDPEWNFPTLASFNNFYNQVDRFVPSNTNISYIVVVVNPGVELLLIDPNGDKTGKQIVDGQVEEFDDIPNATYSFEAPISNPNSDGVIENLGTGVNVLLLPEPIDGNYQLLASSQTNEGYTLNIALFDLDGDLVLQKPVGFVQPNQNDFFDINYSQADNSNSMNILTFQSTIDDIKKAQNSNLITKDSLASNLIRTIEKAESNVLDGRLTLALRRLEHFERTINRNRGDEIAESVYQTLLVDVNYLKTHL